MNADYMPITTQTYDITIQDVQPPVVFTGLDQTEVLKFLSLMPKAEKKYYTRKSSFLEVIISKHEVEKEDGND